jgi:GTPase SAR1 family protein
VKLLFVGKENVGKTSLLQALQAFMAHSASSTTHSSTSLAGSSSSSSTSSTSSSPSTIFFSGQLHYTTDSKLSVKVNDRRAQVRASMLITPLLLVPVPILLLVHSPCGRVQAATFMRTLSTDGIALGELSTEHYAKRKEISVVAGGTLHCTSHCITPCWGSHTTRVVARAAQSKESKSKRKRERPKVIFQTYDFGGQEVFYPTHQVLLLSLLRIL